MDFVRISRILRVRSNTQRVVHNRHFQKAALGRISIVAFVFWVLFCNNVFPIHADRQRNEIQRGRDFAFKLHLHLNFSKRTRACGERIRYNPETGHTVDRPAGGAVRGRPVPAAVPHQGHIRLCGIGQKLETIGGGIGGYDIGMSRGCHGRRLKVTRGGTADGHLGRACHLAVDRKGLASSQNQKTAVSVKVRDGVLELAEDQLRAGRKGKRPAIPEPAAVCQDELAASHRQAGNILKGFGVLIAISGVYHLRRSSSLSVHAGDRVPSGDGDSSGYLVVDRVRNDHFSADRPYGNPVLGATRVYGSQIGANAALHLNGHVARECSIGPVGIRSIVAGVKAAHGQAARVNIAGPKAAVPSLKVGVPLNGHLLRRAGRGDRKIVFIRGRCQRTAEDVDRITSGRYIVQCQVVPVGYDRVASVRACKVQVHVSESHVRAQQNSDRPYRRRMALAINRDVLLDDPWG